MSDMGQATPAGWYPDPLGRYAQRWWDGNAWTENVHQDGETSRDPLGAASGAAAVQASSVPPAPDRPRLPTNAFATALAGCGLAVLGATLPWAEARAGVFSASMNGTEGDGQITLLVGLAAGIVLLANRRRAAAITALILGAIVALIGFIDVSNVQQKADEMRSSSLISVEGHVGAGLWLTCVGGVLMIVGGWIGVAKLRAVRRGAL